MKMSHQIRKALELTITAIVYLLLGYSLLFMLMQPMLRPIHSIYSLVSQQDKKEYMGKDLYQNQQQADHKHIALQDITIPAYGDKYGKIVMNSIHTEVDLYFGDSNAILEQGAGQFQGSHLPGFQKTILIGAHTIPYFQQLDKLRTGDLIELHTHYGIYQYRVSAQKHGRYDDSSMYDLAQEKTEQLILYTCYPLDGIGFKEERWFVYADKISGPVIEGA